ncbi:MipA/OmpV family protein [Bdellovibrio svalbardensis]|uniref:MipA/OmpV family protein n=1 Tax=Bdellovibrio svalbardensis TaxID=2972972 RepID=A0ABT6DN22_9BACT|nr:MipA/OmpV family protein [Bdellovibrio svalbardensis]MDG0817216.1 MipA/OmpV family protein [Bdellovibrio svalbardensis]
MLGRFWFFILTIFLTAVPLQAAEESKPLREEGKPLWEYGFGIGYARYAQYPGSDEYSELVLPFPTFQYRGTILRADDQEGGRAYLLKENKWSLEFSGGGRLPLDSSKSQAREGMENLPLVVEIGPQLIYSVDHSWEFKLALFPSMAIYGSSIRQNGGLASIEVQYRWHDEWGGVFESPLMLSGIFSLEAKTASQEFNATYFEVPLQNATATRPAYSASAGFLENQISYFQRLSSGKLTVYVGGSYSDFSNSANKQSPLLRANSNFEYALGLTYVLGESARRSVPIEDTEGLINRAMQKRNDHLKRFE